jgi:xanthine dehydrogenase accessory factor
MNILPKINKLLNSGEPFCIVTIVSSKIKFISPGTKVIVTSDGTISYSTGSDRIDHFISSQCLTHIKKRKSGTRRFENSLELFFNCVSSETQLLICGAGHIAIPLAQFSVQAGFLVTVLDDRSDFADPPRFPGCNVVAEDFTPAMKDMNLGKNSFVVVITRGHEHDFECLQELLKNELAYVGLIGSRRRVRFVLEMLKNEGIPLERLNEVFTPIGTPIGADSPVEIAISILAELICVRRKGWQQARALRTAVGIDK